MVINIIINRIINKSTAQYKRTTILMKRKKNIIRKHNWLIWLAEYNVTNSFFLMALTPAVNICTEEIRQEPLLFHP